MMFNCHCRDCQKASGSAYAPVIVVPKATVHVRGEPRYHKIVGEAGKAIERGFCPDCGSPVMMKLERIPNILALHACSLDDPSIFRPAMDVFTSSAQPWDHMNPELRKHARGLPSR